MCIPAYIGHHRRVVLVCKWCLPEVCVLVYCCVIYVHRISHGSQELLTSH